MSSAARTVVVGGGVAGLATALHIAPSPVTLLVGSSLGQQAASGWAQGGIAAAIGADDAPEWHAADTAAAGAGLVDSEIAALVAAEAPQAIDWLIRLGASFDRETGGALSLGHEAAHSRRRIVRAGDQTGAEVLRTLIQAVRAEEAVEVVEKVTVIDLLIEDNSVVGVVCAGEDGRPYVMAASRVVLATGGAGGLYASTTNPRSAIGSGLALAARAGAVLRDLEFVQFHPTALAVGLDPMPLATEALRGEGALLLDNRGERFLADTPGQELAPRDVVARAIFNQRLAGRQVFLDASPLGDRLAQSFPGFDASCRQAGLDPRVDPVPVICAAHYHMGGIKVDAAGRSSVAGLWACGEVASTGLHGANRLASNSLAEALVFARRIAQDIDGISPVFRPLRLRGRGIDRYRPAERDDLRVIRRLMDHRFGVIRTEEEMRAGLSRLHALWSGSKEQARWSATVNAAQVAFLIGMSAIARRESRGGHFRTDFPQPAPELAKSSEWTLARAVEAFKHIGDNNHPAIAVAA